MFELEKKSAGALKHLPAEYPVIVDTNCTEVIIIG